MKKKIYYKESYEVLTKSEPFYTGGKIQFTKDGKFILSMCEDRLKLFNIEEGKTEADISNVDEIATFLLADDGETLITAAKNGIMRHWNYPEKVIQKTWKSLHCSPVSCMAFDATSTLLATGGSDCAIKIRDIIRKYYTHNLKGGTGVYSKICFQTIASELCVFGAAADYQINVWNLNSSALIVSLAGHYSTVTDMVFLENSTLLSASRDQVVLVWDLHSLKLESTIPVYETIESVIIAPDGLFLSGLSLSAEDTYFITVGDKGILRVWSSKLCKCVYEQGDSFFFPNNSNYSGPLITQGLFIPALQAICVTTFEHNIILYDIKDFALKKQFAGYIDDILSLKFLGPEDKHLVVATNSSQIKVFQFPNFNCQILKGHSDIVLAVDVCHKHKNRLISGSKDNCVKVWYMDSMSSLINCVYTGYGHTASVYAVACCKNKGHFFASGSEDLTIKLWEIPEKKPLIATKLLLTPYCTVKAHEKHINSLDISENDKFIASTSQDHTAKIWSAEDLSLIATLRGHKMGVWCVQFSPVDLAVATSSGDGTIRIWSLVDFSCLKVFQGHESSVLQLLFLSRGTQLISSASDGNIKLWDIKSNLCMKTLENHKSKVWTLTTSSSEKYLISGGADSTIVVWEDTTVSQREKKMSDKEEFILQEQHLVNLIQEEKWSKALSKAITLDKPYSAYNIIEELLLKKNGRSAVENVLTNMREDQKVCVLKFSSEWITNAKTYYPATVVLSFFYQHYDCQELMKIPSVSSHVRDFLPYLDRHYKRLSRRCQDMQIINFLYQQFKLIPTISRIPSCVQENVIDTEVNISDAKRSCSAEEDANKKTKVS